MLLGRRRLLSTLTRRVLHRASLGAFESSRVVSRHSVRCWLEGATWPDGPTEAHEGITAIFFIDSGGFRAAALTAKKSGRWRLQICRLRSRCWLTGSCPCVVETIRRRVESRSVCIDSDGWHGRRRVTVNVRDRFATPARGAGASKQFLSERLPALVIKNVGTLRLREHPSVTIDANRGAMASCGVNGRPIVDLVEALGVLGVAERSNLLQLWLGYPAQEVVLRKVISCSC